MKKPTTFDEQLNLLKSRGLIIEDDDKCLDILRSVNYYRLSAYILPFRKPDQSYFEGITFERIWSIYEFDRKMRSLLFSIIEEIELYLRTQIAYSHAHKYGETDYLNAAHYNSKHDHSKFLDIVGSAIYEHKNTPIVKHHKANYGGVFPIWVMVEFFSLGTLSRFYSDLMVKDRKAIASQLFNVHYEVLESWMKCLTDLRNSCAHYSRLYYTLFTSYPQFPRGSEYYVSGPRLFDQLMMLKHMFINKQRWNSEVMTELEALIETYGIHISLIHIGFPEDWKEKLENKNTLTAE